MVQIDHLNIIEKGIMGLKISRTQYESAPYTVLRMEGSFEIRDYPALTVVETPMPDGDNQGFRRLF